MNPNQSPISKIPPEVAAMFTAAKSEAVQMAILRALGGPLPAVPVVPSKPAGSPGRPPMVPALVAILRQEFGAGWGSVSEALRIGREMGLRASRQSWKRAVAEHRKTAQWDWQFSLAASC